MKKKFALISVYNKNGLNKICKNFIKHKINIVSTGATAKYIKSLGYKCKLVSDLTKFKEILNGRVKTLHPKIHASLLYNRSKVSHVKTFNKLKFPVIDYVIVNLYPFEKIIKTKINKKNCIEMIDIGGPALLRSSAKNYNSVTTICDVNYYPDLISNLIKNNGYTDLNFRKKMAQKTYATTSNYDLIISNWLQQDQNNKLKIFNHDKIDLRYGENPHQKAYFLKNNSKKSIFDNVIQGKKLSYNNILDVDSAINCLSEFKEPTCVIIKHNNPCAVASRKNIFEAFKKAYAGDPISSFGGIIALNRSVDEKFAKYLSLLFVEIIIAKNFTKKSCLILSKKKQLILIKSNNNKYDKKEEIRSIKGGYISQEKNLIDINSKNIICVSKIKASRQMLQDLIFALKVCKHVKSNAIVLAKNNKTIGIGAGQMSRIDSTKFALIKASKKNKKNGFVAASDAFFPFKDNLQLLIKNNCKSIIQPYGSINDKNIIKYADSHKLPIYFSKYRLFKH